ncbi:hypothetical protein PUN28_013426 [Cardiocondyla obscurior]|uniref:Uncharacterized protein n=1 Tax=Cardiocondyla obscurior TaxID=286306 RepID=A0AAW2F151_9HYME
MYRFHRKFYPMASVNRATRVFGGVQQCTVYQTRPLPCMRSVREIARGSLINVCFSLFLAEKSAFYATLFIVVQELFLHLYNLHSQSINYSRPLDNLSTPPPFPRKSANSFGRN